MHKNKFIRTFKFYGEIIFDVKGDAGIYKKCIKEFKFYGETF